MLSRRYNLVEYFRESAGHPLIFADICSHTHTLTHISQAGFFLLSFRRKMSSDPPPEEIFVKRSPPEPEKIARYLVLSTQKKAKIGGQKNFTP